MFDYKYNMITYIIYLNKDAIPVLENIPACNFVSVTFYKNKMI